MSALEPEGFDCALIACEDCQYFAFVPEDGFAHCCYYGSEDEDGEVMD